MKSLSGLKSNTRAQLGKILRGTNGTVSVSQAASILALPPQKTAMLLARLARQGWLSRVRRGLYIPIPLEAQSSDVIIEDPWLIATELYSPCYIGGWSAAEHWSLTEQIFRSVVVITTKQVRDRAPVIRHIPFVIRTVPKSSMFGIKQVWHGSRKIQVSDPTRTIVDLLDAPKLGGGISSVNEILITYLRSKEFTAKRLLEYVDQLSNRTVYKRLGFLLQRNAPDQRALIEECKSRMSKGSSRLDPGLPSEKLVSAWNLWIPKGWKSATTKVSHD